MPKGGAAPDERELRRLALAVRMYQEGRPHWELPAGERHSRVWEWVWCAAEWALWMLLLLWDLLSRGPPLPERAPPRASPHPTPPRPPHTSLRTRRVKHDMSEPVGADEPTPRSSPALPAASPAPRHTLTAPCRTRPSARLAPAVLYTPLRPPHPPHPPHPHTLPRPSRPSRPSVPAEPTPSSGACRHRAVRPGHPELRPARPPRRRLCSHPLLPRSALIARPPSPPSPILCMPG